MNSEQDLRTVVRDFKASVSADLAGMHRRLDDFNDEVRDRFRIMETAVMNELRDLSQRTDRRADRIEGRIDGLDLRLDDVDERLEGMTSSLARIEDALGGDHRS